MTLRPFAVLSLALIASGADAPPESLSGWPRVASFSFEGGKSDGWDFTDPAAWKVSTQDGRPALELVRQSKYEPKVRSPINIALAPGLDLADVEIAVKVRSTTKDYDHRDLCLFFGHQDPSHFYYVHLGKKADPHANSIFLVDDKPRVSIAEKRTEGTPWTDAWHDVRLVRKVADGRIEVYFDDMKTPAMVAHDKTFLHGRIGVGSFDDTGQFRDLVVWGEKASPPAK